MMRSRPSLRAAVALLAAVGCASEGGSSPPGTGGRGGAAGAPAIADAGVSGAGGAIMDGGGAGGAADPVAGSGGSGAGGFGPDGAVAGSGGTSGGAGVAGAVGVGGAGGLAGGSGGSAGGTAGRGGDAGAGGAPGDPSREIYDPGVFARIDIDLPAASVTALSAVTGPDDPRQDTYVTGTFTYDKGGKNETLANVGFRLKGEGSFKPFREKPAWKIKFDELVDGRRFRGLARMALNNAEDDPAFVAERLAYDVYRAAGVPAPRCNSVTVYVNGAFYGVYNNVEAEDKHFLARWFSNNDGNLYEKNGMLDFTTAGAADFELETNETANDRSDLNALIAAIGRATTPATFLEDLGGNLDTAEWIKFTAVEGIVNEWDSYAFTLWYPHNFRIYDDPATKKFAFIPWGNDMAMQPAPPRITNKQFVRMFELARSQDAPNGRISAGILFQRCLASAPCKAAYKRAIGEVITVWEGLGMEAAAMRYYTQVKPQVYLDNRKVTETGILTNAQFEAAFQGVLGVIRGRLAAVRAELAAN